MRRIILMIMGMIILTSIVSAKVGVIEVDHDVSVDFEGERSFRLLMKNGFERFFNWPENETHEDKTFTHRLYHEISTDQYCEDQDRKVDEYKNITTNIGNVLSVCTDVFRNMNRSEEFITKLTSAEGERNEYERLWRLEEERRINEELRLSGCLNETKEYKSERDDYKDEASTCQNAVAVLKNKETEFNTCKENLDDTKKSKNTSNWMFGGVALIAGYFYWGRKKKGGPSEQAEAGSYSDMPAYREPTAQQPPQDEFQEFGG